MNADIATDYCSSAKKSLAQKWRYCLIRGKNMSSLEMEKCPYCGAWKVRNAVCPACDQL